jgi:hypothetical protein
VATCRCGRRCGKQFEDHGVVPLVAALVIVGAIVILGYATLVGSRSSAFHAIGAAIAAGPSA